MTLDLTQFHDAFYEESFEALDSMESALLKLDLGAPESELINTIFRVAHSIKGGSATFGFTDIASFTHSVETLARRIARPSHAGDAGDVRRAAEIRRRDARDAARARRTRRLRTRSSIADIQFDLELILAQRATAHGLAAPVAAAPTWRRGAAAGASASSRSPNCSSGATTRCAS